MNFDQAHLQPSSRGSSIAICVVCLCLHGCAPVGDTGSTYGAQAWDRLSVPEGTSAELRQLMLSTYSTSAKTRAEAAVKLGEMGEPAASATPFLIRLLCDDELSGLIERATVADLACTALVQLGEPAFESCVAQIRRMPDMEHMSYEAYATGARLISRNGVTAETGSELLFRSRNGVRTIIPEDNAGLKPGLTARPRGHPRRTTSHAHK